MATELLSAVKVKALAQPGRYGDGGGLAMVIQPGGRKSWVLRLRVPDALRTSERDNRRDFGLGAYPGVSLSEARVAAKAILKQVKVGIDPRGGSVEPLSPMAAKAKAEAEAVARAERTFEAVARKVHVEVAPTFKAEKHAAQWLIRLETYAFPSLGAHDVDAITGPMVIDTLAPIWTAKPETARRIRQLITAVLDTAHAKGLRQAPSPTATMLAKGLPAQPRRDGHHAAVDYADAPTVMGRLLADGESTGRLALAFTVFTAARSVETRCATWAEIDMADRVWRVPATRMKMGRAHNVPLSAAALAILARVAAGRETGKPNELLFTCDGKRPLSVNTMLKEQGVIAPNTTPHGWRSTFRDWVAETTDFHPDLADAALAHAIGDATRQAYERGDKLEKRRAVMEAWAGYLTPTPEGVARFKPSRRKSSAA